MAQLAKMYVFMYICLYSFIYVFVNVGHPFLNSQIIIKNILKIKQRYRPGIPMMQRNG